MPVYVYRCRDCGSQTERRQSFSDAPLNRCDACGGRLQKMLQPTTIIYKGSGFYSTDYRSPSGGNGHNGSASKEGTDKAVAAGKEEAAGKESSPGGSGSSSKGDGAKPAAKASPGGD